MIWSSLRLTRLFLSTVQCTRKLLLMPYVLRVRFSSAAISLASIKYLFLRLIYSAAINKVWESVYTYCIFARTSILIISILYILYTPAVPDLYCIESYITLIFNKAFMCFSARKLPRLYPLLCSHAAILSHRIEFFAFKWVDFFTKLFCVFHLWNAKPLANRIKSTREPQRCAAAPTTARCDAAWIFVTRRNRSRNTNHFHYSFSFASLPTLSSPLPLCSAFAFRCLRAAFFLELTGRNEMRWRRWDDIWCDSSWNECIYWMYSTVH